MRRLETLTLFVLAITLGASFAVIARCDPAAARADSTGSANDVDSMALRAPEGTEILDFENIEGEILIRAALRGTSRDTSGCLVVDTGSGYLALDQVVADRLGLLDDLVPPGSIDFADRNLPRLEIGALQMDQLSAVLVLDASMVVAVTDRPVVGLLGQHPLASRLVFIDYGRSRLALIPSATTPSHDSGSRPKTGKSSAKSGARGASDAHDEKSAPPADSTTIAQSRHAFGDLLTPDARAIPFRLAGDGKMIVEARLSSDSGADSSRPLVLIVDTGATKCAFFRAALKHKAPKWERWPSMAGLVAPTLVGVSNASMVRVPKLELVGSDVARTKLDVAVFDSPLSDALSRVVGVPVDGLLGYSFLRRYRVGIDYPRRVLWLDALPEPWDDRPYEYSHVGLQLERRGAVIQVVGVAHGSPAALAEITIGDTLVAIDGTSAKQADLAMLTRRLEGPPGTGVSLLMRHDGEVRSYSLVRRRLL